ncbi:MAG: DNA polymerase III subunit gamma/tau [Candidatus Harrisonbacteria bacterium]|nr:DNA polymerase III subunit gamma/tau [Candidatus Harrisonbacteria bacterium]
MALAIYRKYRPKSFGEFLGQREISEVLKNAARQNRLAHAYLFCGPRGTGKTTAARLLAKLANCLTRKTDSSFHQKGEPCNYCVHCSDIDAGKALDVIEIDAASNRGIDEIRNLKEGIRLSPAVHDHKVVIIDETHMLTKEAFNALLKTLEEPPAHAILVLATTEYEKVPPTISSRCQRFYFRKLPVEEIKSKLKRIALAEKIQATDEALELIASAAEGSLRDAESLFDQMASFSGSIDAEAVEKNLGQVGLARIVTLAGHIFENNLSAALQYIGKLNEGGYNVVDLNKELIHYLRRVISLKVDPNLATLFERQFTAKDLDQLKKHGELVDMNKHINLLRSLIRAYSEMRYSPFASVPLEIAIIENLQKKE